MSNYSDRRGNITRFPGRREAAVQKRRTKENRTAHDSRAESRVVITEYDHIIFIATMILVAFGLVMVLSASYYASINSGGTWYHFFRMQAVGAALGLVGMVIMAGKRTKIPFTNKHFNAMRMLVSVSTPFYIISNTLLLYVALFGEEINGARRWIAWGPVNFQPSELAKVAVILMMAAYISKDINRANNFRGLLGCLAILSLPIGLVFWAGGLSTVIILGAIGFVMVFLASPHFWRFIVLAASGAGAGALALWIDYIRGGFRGARFISGWLDPFSSPTGIGFQTVQSLYAVASGGLFGLGLGNSNQKLYYLPEAQNDFIFAIIVEELGLFGAMFVLLLFGILVWRGSRAAIYSRNILGCLVAAGIVTMISVQVIINVGVVTNTIPNTGIPLPFISYGGTSIAVMMTAMGMLLNISRHQKA